MTILVNIIVFILIIGLIIVIHEFGHFAAAKFFNVYCSNFSIGMGPKIYSHKGKETAFEIRALPIGGFVMMAGENDQEELEEFKDLPPERTLKGKKTYQKVIIFLAGIFMNFVLAIVIMLALNFTVGTLPVNEARVGTLQKDGAAMKYGLKEKDVITNIESVASGKSYIISSYTDMDQAMTKKALGVSGDETLVNVTVKRGKQSLVVKMMVNYDKEASRYKFGFMQATRRMSMTESIRESMSTIALMSVEIFRAIEALVVNFSGTVKQFSGPIGIYRATAQITATGRIENVLYLIALLSVNVGVFNLLPIPGLDGAQTLVAIIEGIARKELPLKIKYGFQLAGLALILLLMIIITYQDVLRLMN